MQVHTPRGPHAHAYGMQVGSVNNTFGIKGVDQYCNFFKSIEDANALRARVSECFERAALPATPDEVCANGTKCCWHHWGQRMDAGVRVGELAHGAFVGICLPCPT